MSENIVILYSERDFKSTVSASKMNSSLFKECVKHADVTLSSDRIVMFEDGTNIEKLSIESVNLNKIKANQIFIEKELVGVEGVLKFATNITKEIYTYDIDEEIIYLGDVFNE